MRKNEAAKIVQLIFQPIRKVHVKQLLALENTSFRKHHAGAAGEQDIKQLKRSSPNRKSCID